MGTVPHAVHVITLASLPQVDEGRTQRIAIAIQQLPWTQADTEQLLLKMQHAPVDSPTFPHRPASIAGAESDPRQVAFPFFSDPVDLSRRKA
jgi:hypothetical protein